MNTALRVALPIAVLAAGLGIYAFLKSTRPEAEKKERKESGVLVEVTTVEPKRDQVSVEANGTVMPARQVAVSPEVSGRVQWVNPDLEPGNTLDEGEVLIRIDGSDYRLAVKQQRSAVDQARTQLKIEKSRKKIAEREWEMLGEGEPKEDSLALREPQLKTAEVAVESAQSGLDRAKLAVSRTVVRVPFDAVVQQKQVEVGQMVGPQAPVATLVGTDSYWVQVSVPVSRLSWLSIPGVAGATEGSPARVWQKVDGDQLGRIERSGRIVRMLPDLDPVGRMARVLVEVDDPLGLEAGETIGPEGEPKPRQMPLILGSYVSVELQGRQVDGVIELPREALREGDKVFVMDEDDELRIQGVDVIWRRPDTVLLAGGLGAGARVVTTSIAAPVEGMKLRTPDMIAAEKAGDDGADSSTVPEDASESEPDGPTDERAAKPSARETPEVAKP